MNHTLVTFLGRTRQDPNTGYQRAKYRFPGERTPRETPFFGMALAGHLRPDAAVILGTSGSQWSVLVEHLAGSRELDSGPVPSRACPDEAHSFTGRHQLKIRKRVSFRGRDERVPAPEGNVVGHRGILDFVQQKQPVRHERLGKRIQRHVDSRTNRVGPIDDARDHRVVDSNAQRGPRRGQLGSADRLRVHPLSLDPDRHGSLRCRGAIRPDGAETPCTLRYRLAHQSHAGAVGGVGERASSVRRRRQPPTGSALTSVAARSCGWADGEGSATPHHPPAPPPHPPIPPGNP